MSKGNRTLRFSSIDAMPESLRKMVVGQEPVGMCTLRQPIEEARNRARSVLMNKSSALGPTTFKPLAKNKYGAVATVVDGIRFDSKREARYYERLLVRRRSGEVRYFLRQVALHLRGGTRYVVDFMEVHADDSIHWVDVKGFITQVFAIKRREIEATYPIKIEVVK